MRGLRLFLILTVLLFSTGSILSANTENGWPGDSLRKNTGFIFGINMGAFWAHKYQAGFYNGSPGNVDSIGLIFSNYYYKEDIRRELNDTFRLLELPADMRYQPAMQVGFYVKYNITPTTGAFIQFNYSKVKTKDVFTMGIGGEPQYLTFDDIRMYPIWGSEERIFIDIGFSQTFPVDKIFQPFLEAGVNFNNTRVIENKIAINNLEYSLINVYGNSPYIPNTQMQVYETRLGGLGVGGFASAGFRMVFSKNISLDPGFTFLWNKANLEGYGAYKPHYSVWMRFCFQNLFGNSGSQDE